MVQDLFHAEYNRRDLILERHVPGGADHQAERSGSKRELCRHAVGVAVADSNPGSVQPQSGGLEIGKDFGGAPVACMPHKSLEICEACRL